MASASSNRVRLAIPLLLLLLLRHAATAALSAAPRTTFPGDKAALASLMSAVDAATIPSYSCLASWDFARDPCATFPCGLRCYAAPNDSSYLRVAGISLDPAGYSGTLPAPVLASLPFLAFLSLTGNRFHGALPAGSPLPPSLRVLDLSANAFSGAIPASLFTAPSALQELDLSRNAFTGRIPSQIASLGALTRIDLQHNGLTGSLPWMGDMRSLARLDVSGNTLSGSLLDALPRQVVSVVARNSGISGPLKAAAFDALPAMQVLDLTGNAVPGAVPGAVFRHPALQQLRLGSNQLGSVEEPASGVGASSSRLVELDLSGNRIAGRLPRCLAAMPRLAVVGLDRNRFTGGIPNEYVVRVADEAAADDGQRAPFARLMLQGNYLCGALPSQMRTLKEGGAVVSLADNCLLRCPHKFFFCKGAPQKDHAACPKCEA
ncbi:probable LRR receptor-like serine/threonine-protein kinase At4g36180 [Brachypodium distachyon]|uniref:probable LRR receptor-like serine/threonine-protein kinase At4g36180 n=1 Tax=Brachypodium distachyon TaxID=15368 RepID=UPI0001C747A3|nr:probable LRR receptor-like serine/threonine-protein kinase At4g36180 [Brachypodium distachyon]|eukprot:XP_010235773.1 probable LRR receptor-like serine/threonine-protein kinase At4g36180 [Brachypodium distachyon]